MADIIDRLHQPYRIYKPLYLDYKDVYSLKRDLDRELESISQSLLYVTQKLDTHEEADRLLLQASTDPAVKAYLQGFSWDKSADPHESDPTGHPTPDPTKWKTLWPAK